MNCILKSILPLLDIDLIIIVNKNVFKSLFLLTGLKFNKKEWILARSMSLLVASITPELKAIEAAGTWKKERVIASPQRARIVLTNGIEALNFCANNYLGLSVSSIINYYYNLIHCVNYIFFIFSFRTITK